MDVAHPPAEATIAQLAPAKINLALHVTGRRADGYHLLESLVVFTRFGDRLHISRAARDSLTIDGPFAAELHAGQDNLVARAREALRAAARHAAEPVAIRLEKNLPVASGIGGGSSDAAAALRSLNGLWHCGLDNKALAELGAILGADLPMCLAAQPLIARGIGELLEPVTTLPPIAMVLANPGVAVATPAVFSALASRDNPPLPPLPGRLDFRTLVGWLDTTRNDLEAPARLIAPAIAETLDALRACGAAVARMSGSGATCFGLFATQAAAENAAALLRRTRPDWFVAATQTLTA